MDYKQVKRLLALLKAQVEHPERDIQVDLPEGFKESFENQKYFRGWVNYHETWDVTKADPWTVIPRRVSLVTEWHQELVKVVPMILPDGTILEAGNGRKSHL